MSAGPGCILCLPRYLDDVAVGIEALETDVALRVLVLDELDAVSDESSPKPPDFLGRICVEAEMREARAPLWRLVWSQSQGEVVGVANDDDAVRYRRAVEGSKPKNVE
jgi:hypothetical protein